MLIIFYLLLMLIEGRCRVDQIIQRQTFGLGDDVTLYCSPESWDRMVWIRLVSGNLPEVLGKTFSSESVDPRITAAVEYRSFVLRIKGAKLSDSTVYYCMKIDTLTFLKGVEMKVKGPGPDITAAPPSPSAPVRPGNSVTLQCSVLSDSENKRCGEDHSVCCFSAELDESRSEKCSHIFENICSTSVGTSNSTVTTCRGRFCGNGIKRDTEVFSAVSMWDSLNTVLLVLYAALAFSLIVIAFSICSTEACDSCNCAATIHQNQHVRNLQVYSAVVFTTMESGSGRKRDTKAAETERIYATVKAFGFN